MGIYQQTHCFPNYTFPIHRYRCANESSLAQQSLLSDFKFSALVKLAALPVSAAAGSSGHFGSFFLFHRVRGCGAHGRRQPASQLHDGHQGFRLRSQFPWSSAGVWVAEPWPALLRNRCSPVVVQSASPAKIQRPFPKKHHDFLLANCCSKETHPI